MKINEILNEVVIHAAQINHLRARIKIVAALCDNMGSYPLIYREFNAKTPATPILKVMADEHFQYKAKGSSISVQSEIMQKLGIKNPAFCMMKTPSFIHGFHGRSRIFVPPLNYRVFWSPEVKDLGGNTVVGKDADKYGMIVTNLPGGGSTGHMDNSRRIPASFASTYIEGLPKEYTDNELLFDCEEYYLIDIEEFLSKYAGKAAKEIIHFPMRKIPGTEIEIKSAFAQLKSELFNTKFKDYRTLAWYFRNPVLGYLDWLEKRVS